ncbi:MAG TPA: AAA family ATPase [Longimicrobium sp.]|jgi:hypothetical protein
MSTANGLPLRSFAVEGYRGILELRLPDLERVNLFVGTNNAGKTALLEALRLYATQFLPGDLIGILRDRSGFQVSFSSAGQRGDPTAEEIEFAFDAARALFHGSYSASPSPIRIGPVGDDAGLELHLPWVTDEASESGQDLLAEPTTVLVRASRGGRIFDIPLSNLLGGVLTRLNGSTSRVEFVPAQGLDARRVAALWDSAAEAGSAQAVEDALRVVVPELERVFLLGSRATRRVVLQLGGGTRAVAIANMGDGTNRIFAIALACVRAAGGILLVDEVENGLHHSVQEAVWTTIFTLAEQFGVQVFATTHSWDAVYGFQAAAANSPSRGLLYRLDRRVPGAVRAVRYTDEEISIAADQQIEVR